VTSFKKDNALRQPMAMTEERPLAKSPAIRSTSKIAIEHIFPINGVGNIHGSQQSRREIPLRQGAKSRAGLEFTGYKPNRLPVLIG